jgi:hypothetical protein
MKMILMFLSLVFCMMTLPAQAALNNANNPHVMCIPLGSLAADGVVLAGASEKAIDVSAVYLLNAGTIAADNANYVILELKKGSTVVAEMDSRAAHENGITANTVEPLNVVSAQKAIASQSVLSVNYDETDAGTNVALSGAVLCMQYSVR